MTACEKGLNPSTRLRAAFSFGRSRCGNSAVINHVRSDFPLKLKSANHAISTKVTDFHSVQLNIVYLT
uniref:Uncharacterized protein n=1 Tax=Anguilla anguilla TaxID=7936 RepID=A0A0E9R9C0_ANGAN